ncbi:MAG: DNA repair protein RecN [Lachnospiraceae bacterium]|nr:DNA repair protein RecN [Lachnospiraceae bacterium]
MLDSLHVKNLALIEEEEIVFGEALNILTGETGAGKSIVLGSINLALGAKTGSEVIRSGAEYALVELSFSLNDEEIRRVRELDLDVEDDGVLIISRKIGNGKSVLKVNGETVTAALVKKIAAILLDIYGQNENQNLLKSSSYEKMLDEYAGDEVASLKKELKEKKNRYNGIVSELEEEDRDTAVTKREIELLEYEIATINDAAIKPGEDEELESRFRLISNSRKIMEALSETHRMTGYDSPESVGSVLGNALSRIKSVASFDDKISELCEELSQAEDLIGDFNRALSSYEDGMSFDEEEFDRISSRLDFINDLKAKFGRSIEDIQRSLAEKEERLDKLVNHDSYIAGLKSERDALWKEMQGICERISGLRKNAASGLGKELKTAMEGLNFLNTELRIDVLPDPENIRDSGYDNIEFLISLNVGEGLKPMQNVASGGELSRIMLAIKSVFADAGDVPTLVFDEIDSGISGKTAYMVAQKMNELAGDHQLICITHLPQIASMADSHFLIEKSVSEGRTVTGIRKLDEEGSIRELARMLGNDDITEAAIENAREMKKGKGSGTAPGRNR